MINRLDALSIRSQVVDNLRVRMAHHSVITEHKHIIEVSNLIDEVLSNYIDNSLMIGDARDESEVNSEDIKADPQLEG